MLSGSGGKYVVVPDYISVQDMMPRVAWPACCGATKTTKSTPGGTCICRHEILFKPHIAFQHIPTWQAPDFSFLPLLAYELNGIALQPIMLAVLSIYVNSNKICST